ncbi:hypothetical protein D9M73_247120 [compost metagenome]
MHQAEVLHLLLDLVQAVANDFQHVAALGQLALQGEQGEGVTQGFALQAGGLAFQGAGQGLVAVAQVDVVAAVDFQGVLRVADQQTAEHAAQRRFADLAGLGDAVHQGGGFEDGAEGDQLLAGLVHGRWTPASQGSALSITPPPRQISPS